MKKNLDLRGVGLGIGVGLVGMLALTGGFAWLVSNEIVGREQLYLAAAGILLIGSLLGALCCGRGEGRWIRCAIMALGLALGLLALNLTFFDGSLAGLIPGVPVVAAGAAVGALATGSKKGRTKYRKYRHR